MPNYDIAQLLNDAPFLLYPFSNTVTSTAFTCRVELFVSLAIVGVLPSVWGVRESPRAILCCFLYGLKEMSVKKTT
jgi:hypothetical protein